MAPRSGAWYETHGQPERKEILTFLPGSGLVIKNKKRTRGTSCVGFWGREILFSRKRAD